MEISVGDNFDKNRSYRRKIRTKSGGKSETVRIILTTSAHPGTLLVDCLLILKLSIPSFVGHLTDAVTSCADICRGVTSLIFRLSEKKRQYNQLDSTNHERY